MKRELRVSLAWASAIILLSLGATFARQLGYIDAETSLRVVAMNGLLVAYYGNRAPKSVAPTTHARQVARFTGWALVLSGLVYAGFWALAPIRTAMVFGTGAVALGVLLSLGYCVKLRAQAGQYSGHGGR